MLLCSFFIVVLCHILQHQSESQAFATLHLPSSSPAPHSLHGVDYATHCNPLCRCNPPLSGVPGDSSPRGHLSSCCLLCHSDYTSHPLCSR